MSFLRKTLSEFNLNNATSQVDLFDLNLSQKELNEIWWRNASICPTQVSGNFSPNSPKETCQSCNTKFKLIFNLKLNKYQCRACGYYFCDDCCKLKLTLPQYEIFTQERICIKCYPIQQQIQNLANELRESEKKCNEQTELCNDIERNYFAILLKGETFKKFSHSNWKQKFLVLDSNFNHLMFYETEKREIIKTISVSSITEVKLTSVANIIKVSNISKTYKKEKEKEKEKENPENCISIISKEKTFNFKTDDSSKLEQWLESLSKLLQFQNLQKQLNENKTNFQMKKNQIIQFIYQQRPPTESSPPLELVTSNHLDISITPAPSNENSLPSSPSSSSVNQSMEMNKEAIKNNIEVAERLVDKTLRLRENAKKCSEQSQKLSITS